MRNYNRRRSTLVLLLAAGALLCAVTLAGELLAKERGRRFYPQESCPLLELSLWD